MALQARRVAHLRMALYCGHVFGFVTLCAKLLGVLYQEFGLHAAVRFVARSAIVDCAVPKLRFLQEIVMAFKAVRFAGLNKQSLVIGGVWSVAREAFAILERLMDELRLGRWIVVALRAERLAGFGQQAFGV